MAAGLGGGEWSAARPSRTLPPGKTRYPLYRRLGGPQGRSGRAENLFPTGIRSRTVQPVVSPYTDMYVYTHTHTHIYIYIHWTEHKMKMSFEVEEKKLYREKAVDNSNRSAAWDLFVYCKEWPSETEYQTYK